MPAHPRRQLRKRRSRELMERRSHERTPEWHSHEPLKRRSGKLATRFAAVLAATCVALSTVSYDVAFADPDPSVDEVRDKVENLDQKVDTLAEQYNQARIEFDSTTKHVHELRGRAKKQKDELAELRDQIATMAAAAYRSGGLGAVAMMFGSEDPQSFIDRAASLDVLARDRKAQVRDYKAKLARLRHQRSAAKHALAKRTHLKEDLARHKDEIESKLADKRDLLEEVSAPIYSGGAATGATYNGPATGSARAALEFAYAQVGKPYQWGAAGPSAYDCSGLTMAAWGAAGVSLPHSSQLQYSSGPHVASSNLRPGDLVFFGSPIHHVGIYVGHGTMIHAPHSGATVRAESITSGWYAEEYVGAIRP